MNSIIKKFEKKELNLNKPWGLEADKIESKISKVRDREKFWLEILRYILKKESPL